MHVSEDDLVLHYYGELEPAVERGTAEHLAVCAACRANFAALQRVLAAVEAAPAPVLPDGFERTVWARLQPSLPVRRTGWTAWMPLSPGRLALAAAVMLLVAGAFFAGRVSQEEAAPILATDDLRERILLVDLSEHLDRSQNMLVELVSAEAVGTLDMAAERERAEDLVAANRLYRQTAAATGDNAIGDLLDDLERLLVDLAASPDQPSQDDMDAVRSRIDAEGLLFKLRVLSSAVRERQQQQIRTRAGQSS
ncbi:hypothetical protein BH23ACI1_BH23ACI1_07950 [soil metagenome]|nr:hypothetical protein [Acidobacteriota bacterium]